jgi:hypothetical protein
MDQNEFLQRTIETTDQLLLVSQEQKIISSRLLAMIERHDAKLNNHEEQINRLIRVEERLQDFIDRNGRS